MIRARWFPRLLLLFGLCLFISLANENFVNSGNIINVLRQAAILNILGIAMTLVIITGGIDLSNGAVLALCSCIAGILLKAEFPILLSLFVAIAIGACCGLFNGWMVAGLRIPPFIITYAMMFFARGLAYLSLQGKILYGFKPAFRFIGAGDVGGLPVPIVISVIVTIGFLFLQKFTAFGSEVFAVGADEEAARLAGIRTRSILIRIYILSGALSAVGGIIYTSRLNAAEPVIGESFPLDAIAAVIIGGTPLTGGEGGIGGTILGALIITVIINAMNLMGVSSLLQSFVLGTLILIMISIQIYSRKLTAKACFMKTLGFENKTPL
jgi:ribose transport system permease protein